MRRMCLSAFLVMALACTRAGACKLAAEAYVLEAFLASDTPGKVVFTARVRSVATKHLNTGMSLQEIKLETGQWFRGQPRKHVHARGAMGTMPGTSCEGQFDFRVSEGEE